MQAILITAYKNEAMLKNLIQYFEDKARVYVHIDANSPLDPKRIQIPEYKNLTVWKLYKTEWGSLNHLLAFLRMMRAALECEDVEYVHLITGQTLPIRSLKDFLARFEGEKHIFMQVNDSSTFTREMVRRFRYYVVNANWDRRKKWVKRLYSITSFLQKIFFVNRTHLGKYRIEYIGQSDYSLPRDAAEYLLNTYDSSAKLRFDLRHMNICEEMFAQQILMNSPFRKDIVNDNLRYVDWKPRHGHEPAILDETDLDVLMNGLFAHDPVFARKIESGVSDRLVSEIKESIGWRC